MTEFLLEVGCEEIPAAWFAPPVDIRQALQSAFVALAAQERIAPDRSGPPRVFSTPRRLVLNAPLLERQPDRTTIQWGPAVGASRGKDGAWTGAAVGFASKFGAKPEDLPEGPRDPKKPAERYLFYERREAGRLAIEVLPGLIAATLRRLSFPKRMSWDAWLEDGKGAFPFARPIRWIVALLDGEVVPFAIHELRGGGRGQVLVSSGNRSRGHRFLPVGRADEAFRVDSFGSLQKTLRENCVILDSGERDERIRKGLKTALGEIPSDHGLIAEWRELVEYPTVVLGQIPHEFQALPTEVLQTVLVHHQKYIPIVSDGVAVSRFAAVTNAEASSGGPIVKGMERVVVARLRDAAFFFEEDMKRPLQDRARDLAGITFHEGLGTYAHKTERVVKLVDAMGPMGLLTKDEHRAAVEAARLAKTDLTTLMVREFPELQGVMGGIYLLAQGNCREDVAQAVRWHHHPVSIEADALPAGKVEGSEATIFAAVSLADKLDTLVGYFGIGLEPKGSSDPYGLRRAGQGALRVLIDFWRADAAEERPDLTQLVRKSVEGYGGTIKNPQTASVLSLFLLDRLEHVLLSRGFPQGEVAAVMYADPNSPGISALEDVYDCYARLKALHRVRELAKEDFEHLAVAFKRARNILANAPSGDVDSGLFEGQSERELHEAVLGLRKTDRGHEARLRALAKLRGPVDRFFDDVLVMADDPKIRANRLGLLAETIALFYRIADISKLGG